MSDQSAGLLGSPVAQVPVQQDPAVQHAIEWIQQARRNELKQSNPSNSIGKSRKHFNPDRALILGGPEVVPM